MSPGATTMQSYLAQALEDLHSRLASSVLGLDEEALPWHPVPGSPSVAELVVSVAREERCWIGEGVAHLPGDDDSDCLQAGGSPGDHPLFWLGSSAQLSQVILSTLAAADWLAPCQVGDRSTVVAGCVLHVLQELAGVLGRVELIGQLWDARVAQLESRRLL